MFEGMGDSALQLQGDQAWSVHCQQGRTGLRDLQIRVAFIRGTTLLWLGRLQGVCNNIGRGLETIECIYNQARRELRAERGAQSGLPIVPGGPLSVPNSLSTSVGRLTVPVLCSR